MTVPTTRPVAREDGEATAGAQEGERVPCLCSLGRRGAWKLGGEEGWGSGSWAWEGAPSPGNQARARCVAAGRRGEPAEPQGPGTGEAGGVGMAEWVEGGPSRGLEVLWEPAECQGPWVEVEGPPRDSDPLTRALGSRPADGGPAWVRGRARCAPSRPLPSAAPRHPRGAPCGLGQRKQLTRTFPPQELISSSAEPRWKNPPPWSSSGLGMISFWKYVA